jgi:hypothetical protein
MLAAYKCRLLSPCYFDLGLFKRLNKIFIVYTSPQNVTNKQAHEGSRP